MRFTEFYETIGPHQGQELELMRRGEKPAALIWPRELPKWRRDIKTHKWTVTKITVFGGQSSVVVSQDPNTGNQIQKLFTDVGDTRPVPAKFHEQLGRLLGYSDADINHFLAQQQKNL